jgi:MtfA peptidase
MSVSAWTGAFKSAYDDLVAALDRNEDTWLDPYAAEDPGEFFAVCTEVFFDVPTELALFYPDIFAQLEAFYRQTPASLL